MGRSCFKNTPKPNNFDAFALTGVPKQLLYISLFQQVGRKRVAQGVHSGFGVYHGAHFSFSEEFLYAAFAVLPAVGAFKYPFDGFIYFQIGIQVIPRFFRKDGTTVFIAFPGPDKQGVLLGATDFRSLYDAR